MNKFNIPLVAEGLTAYAIERQNGWERHRPEGAPPPGWSAGAFGQTPSSKV